MLHWKNGHKAQCQGRQEGGVAKKSSGSTSLSLLLPEMEVVTEPEPEEGEEAGGERSEEARLKEFDEFVRHHGNAGTLDSAAGVSELTEAVGDGMADKQFKAFKRRIARSPDQVCGCQLNACLFVCLFVCFVLWAYGQLCD